MDLYRLPLDCDLSILGIPSIYEDNVCLIEWPQRITQENLPENYLQVNIDVDTNQGRLFTMKFIGQKWRSRLDSLVDLLTEYDDDYDDDDDDDGDDDDDFYFENSK